MARLQKPRRTAEIERYQQPDELAAVRAKLASVARQSRMVHAAALLTQHQ